MSPGNATEPLVKQRNVAKHIKIHEDEKYGIERHFEFEPPGAQCLLQSMISIGGDGGAKWNSYITIVKQLRIGAGSGLVGPPNSYALATNSANRRYKKYLN